MSNQRLILFWLFPYHSPTLLHHPSSSLSRPRCDCGRPDCWLTAARFSLQSSRDERLEKCRQPLLTGRKINQRRLLPLLRRKARGQHVSPELCNLPKTEADTRRHVSTVWWRILNFLLVQNCNYFSLSLAVLQTPALTPLPSKTFLSLLRTTSQTFPSFAVLCWSSRLISCISNCFLCHLLMAFLLVFIFAACCPFPDVTGLFAGQSPVTNRSEGSREKYEGVRSLKSWEGRQEMQGGSIPDKSRE